MAFHGFPTEPNPLVIGHRGVSGHAPENTLAAFQLAVAAGTTHCDGVELDIHATADGELVVHHDPVLSTGEVIAALPLDTLRRILLPDGSVIPTLAEALNVLGDLQVFIEAKTLPPSCDARLLALIRQDGASRRYHVHSFDHRVIARLHRQAPALSLGVLSCSYPIDPIRQARDAGAATLWQESHLLDKALIAACLAGGIKVIAWTVSDPAEAARLREMGVAGLCGNWPERLRP